MVYGLLLKKKGNKMKKMVFIFIASLILVSNSVQAQEIRENPSSGWPTPRWLERETKLAPVFNATMLGAGIGLGVGLAVSALSPNKEDTEAEAWAKIRNRAIRGTGLGVLFGLIYGIIEASNFSGSVDLQQEQRHIMLAYNYKF